MTLRISHLLALLASLSFCVLPLHGQDDDTPPKTSSKKKGAAGAAAAKKKALAEAAPDEPATPSPTKKKSTTTSTGSKKKKSADDEDADSTSSTAKKKTDNDTDEPLPKKSGTAKKSDNSSSSGTKDSAAKTDDGKSSESKSKDKESKTDETAKIDPKPAVDTETAKHDHAPAAVVEPEKIADFAKQPEKIQQVIRAAIDLTRQNLTYTFGSSDPANGGMDCSGTIYHLMRANGFPDIPRDSSGQYLWARKSGAFFPVVSKSADSPEFAQLQPGDLMFWTGTYETGRDVPISHVMMYLGKEKGSGKRIMFGASDGRSYDGIQRWGVSVFDFKMPKADPANPEKAKVDFVGYARVPGLRTVATGEVASAAAETKAPEEAAKQAEEKSNSTASSKSKAAAADDDSDSPKPKATPSSTTRKRKRSSSN